MTVLKSMTSRLIVAGAVLASHLASGAEPVSENQIIKLPELGATGKAYVSWYFLRSGVIWQNGSIVDLRALSWPQWDRQQIPARLIPVPAQKAFVIVYDSVGKASDRIELKDSFSPSQYQESAPPSSYRIELILNGERLRILGPSYPWITPKKIASCELELGDSSAQIDKNRKLATCMDTLKAYAGDERPGRPEYYIKLNWPSIKGKENIMASKSLERDLKAIARRSKTIFISDRTRGSVFRAEVGATQNEKLPMIGLPVEQFADTQAAMPSPDTKKVEEEFSKLVASDGSTVTFHARYNDAQEERSITSPVFGGRRIFLQVMKDESGGSAAKVEETRDVERHTGVFGLLRPWQVLAFGNVNFLTSSRGENNTIIGLPGLDLKYSTGIWDLQPFLILENQILHLGSSLSIAELKAGVSQKIKFLPGTFYSLGYDRYSLSGENRGTSRLGNFDAILFGLGASQRKENWMFRESASALAGNSMSLDLRADAGKFVRLGLGDKIYLGGFVGYSQYRAYVVNKINNRELFSESRLQIGIAAGWVGQDTY